MLCSVRETHLEPPMPDAIPRVGGAHHRGIGEVAEPRAAERRGRVVAVKVNEASVHALFVEPVRDLTFSFLKRM